MPFHRKFCGMATTEIKPLVFQKNGDFKYVKWKNTIMIVIFEK